MERHRRQRGRDRGGVPGGRPAHGRRGGRSRFSVVGTPASRRDARRESEPPPPERPRPRGRRGLRLAVPVPVPVPVPGTREAPRAPRPVRPLRRRRRQKRRRRVAPVVAASIRRQVRGRLRLVRRTRGRPGRQQRRRGLLLRLRAGSRRLGSRRPARAGVGVEVLREPPGGAVGIFRGGNRRRRRRRRPARARPPAGRKRKRRKRRVRRCERHSSGRVGARSSPRARARGGERGARGRRVRVGASAGVPRQAPRGARDDVRARRAFIRRRLEDVSRAAPGRVRGPARRRLGRGRAGSGLRPGRAPREPGSTAVRADAVARKPGEPPLRPPSRFRIGRLSRSRSRRRSLRLRLRLRGGRRDRPGCASAPPRDTRAGGRGEHGAGD